MAKTTVKHFEIFKAECEKWIDEFGLKNWVIRIYHESAVNDCLASFSARVLDRVASIFLNKEWKKNEATNYELSRTAYHEVCHILLLRLQWLAEQRTTCIQEIEEEVHNIIRILENSHFRKP